MAGPEPKDCPPELHDAAINAEGRGLSSVNGMNAVLFLCCSHSLWRLCFDPIF